MAATAYRCRGQRTTVLALRSPLTGSTRSISRTTLSPMDGWHQKATRPRLFLNERNAMAARTISGSEISEGTPTAALASTKTMTAKIVNSPTTATTHGLRALTPRFYTWPPNRPRHPHAPMHITPLAANSLFFPIGTERCRSAGARAVKFENGAAHTEAKRPLIPNDCPGGGVNAFRNLHGAAAPNDGIQLGTCIRRNTRGLKRGLCLDACLSAVIVGRRHREQRRGLPRRFTAVVVYGVELDQQRGIRAFLRCHKRCREGHLVALPEHFRCRLDVRRRCMVILPPWRRLPGEFP